jgi:hypothetical protein
MVSGLAALVLEAEGVQLAAGDVNPTSLSNQDLVVRMIQCGAEATAPRGVINVPATFTECLP